MSERKDPKRNKPTRQSRKLNFVGRLREGVRRWTDRVLAADMAWSGLCVVVLVLLLGAQRCGSDYSELRVGQVAARDIRASRDANIIDLELTQAQREKAGDSISQVYIYDTERGARLGSQIAALFAEGRKTLEGLSLEGSEDALSVARERLATALPDDALEVLLNQKFDPALERELKSALGQVMDRRIVGNKALLQREEAITLVRIPGNVREKISDYSAIESLDQSRKALSEITRLSLPRDQQTVLIGFLETFVDSNVTPDPEATLRAREASAAAVPPVLNRISEGEILIAKGDTISAEKLQRLNDVEASGRTVPTHQYFLGILLISSMTAFFLFRYTRYHQRSFKKIRHLHALMVLCLTGMLGTAWALLWLSGVVAEQLSSPFNQLDTYHYMMPLAAAPILLALLANGRIAMVYSGFAALLYGAMCGWDPHLMVWAMLVQCAGVYAISTDRERTALLRAGFLVGGAAAVTSLAMETLKGTLDDPLSHSMYGAGLALLGGGIGVGLLVSFALPLLERLFNVLTDIRLLELSNSSHPLLAQLAMKAPGTYNHSLVVGNLAEEAAKAIGANSLFCKVAASYHDVGKMVKPEYFVENQLHQNPHDRLAPSMSSLIIASHVKDGVKMAREAGLPEQIIDIIPQHHGTRLMSFFFEKAKKQSTAGLGDVKEEEFRYPGPKPQTREGAIFMIADGVEAAARTVGDPTANRLKDMITKVTNAIVLDRQLDECDLTFSDLTKIQEALLKRLVSMYHQRIEYPGFNFNKDDDDDGDPDSETAEEEQVAP